MVSLESPAAERKIARARSASARRVDRARLSSAERSSSLTTGLFVPFRYPRVAILDARWIPSSFLLRVWVIQTGRQHDPLSSLHS